MREHNVELNDPRPLRRSAEPLATRCTGAFFPELVRRCVSEAHAVLAHTARTRSNLDPISLHAAGDRLRVGARAKGSLAAPVRHVLFVDACDTGPARLAAGLLAHHAGTAVVARSAGVRPGTAVDPFAVEILAQHGIEPATVTPRPLTEDLLRAADWVVTLGDPELGPTSPITITQHWPVGEVFGERPDPSLVAELDNRVQALWVEITAGDMPLARGSCARWGRP